MTLFLFKITLCWGFFALLYTLLLRHETFFRANRMYLLGTVALGILLAAWPAEQLPVPTDDTGMSVIELPTFTVGLKQVEVVSSQWERAEYLWLIYWVGFALALARVLWGIYVIVRMAHRGHAEQLREGGVLIRTAEAQVPFSFFQWVFVPLGLEEEMKESNALMLAHERAHARGWHSVDVIFMEVLSAVFWFHPLAHWFRKSLRSVHEYLADAEASRLSDRKQYGLLLIGQSQSGMPIAFANHFFQSPLKQRLVMLTKKTSAPIRAIKFGLVAPAALLFAMLFRQAPAIAQVVDEKHLQFVRDLETKGWALTDTVITFDPITYEEKVQIVRNSAAPELDENGNLVYLYAEVQPQFIGGQEALSKFLMDNLKYPESAKQKNKEGTVYISFVVDETGNLLHPRAKYYDESSRLLVEEAERVVRAMPKWAPAKHKGKAVRCSVSLPVKFSLAKPVAQSTDVEPEFPGGMEAMMKYLTENLRYPESARTAKAEGVAVISFTVKEDGSLAEVKPGLNDPSMHPDLITEAIRVVKAMPKWKPAIKNGQVMKATLSIPIKFKLAGPATAELFEVDVQPEYPGGLQEMYKFLGAQIKYPEAARNEKAEGMVVITFVVETDGSLSSFESVKTVRQDFSNEVIRVLKLSPKWKPGQKDGKTVKVKYTLPFKFQL